MHPLYTGVPPLAMLFGLVFFSIPWVRNRFYETFWHLHIILALSYLGLMFWHAGQEQDSWAYLWATLALLLASVIARVFHFNRAFNLRTQWLQGAPVRLRALAGGAALIEVTAPDGFDWRPGQHCYLRLPSVRFWRNHPFTIANSPQAASKDSTQAVSFLVRKRGGFTGLLHSFASSQSNRTAKAILDGPYGGYRYRLEDSYEQLILVAGGSGITACFPWLQHVAATKAKGDVVTLRHISLVWVVQRKEHLSWLDADILKALKSAGDIGITVDLCITSDAKAAAATADERSTLDVEKQPEAANEMKSHSLDKETSLEPHRMVIHHRKPFLGKLLPSLLEGNKVFVLGKLLYLSSSEFPCSPLSVNNRLSSLWPRIAEDRHKQCVRCCAV